MKQYIELLKAIKENGSQKGEARENMPTTLSLFGYQFRHNLADGFPLITTKKMPWKGVVCELLWFLKGDTNIKYLDENNVTYMWHEDAYNYYLKFAKANDEMVNTILQPISLSKNSRDVPYGEHDSYSIMTFEEFCKKIRETSKDKLPRYKNYTLGDCGKQYGWLWRNWNAPETELFSISSAIPQDQINKFLEDWRKFQPERFALFTYNNDHQDLDIEPVYKRVDQIKNLIEGLKKSPFSRRHILTAWNPTTLQDMALNACHCFVQFNCRSLKITERLNLCHENLKKELDERVPVDDVLRQLDNSNIPKYYLDCQLYQRSADVILGIPFNIASYALLTEILAKICNMIPGEFIHTFGDVHIYSNHMEAVEEQLLREPKELPKLNINTEFWEAEGGSCGEGPLSVDGFLKGLENPSFLKCLVKEDIQLGNYNPHPKLESETKLSTGLK